MTEITAVARGHLVTVDILVFRATSERHELLCIQRTHAPFEGHWALPGGFVDADESLDAAAARELREETGLDALPLRQLGAFGDPDRDPRGRSITIAYYALLTSEQQVRAEDDAAVARWFSLDDLPEMAFDHHEIVRSAVRRIPFLSS